MTIGRIPALDAVLEHGASASFDLGVLLNYPLGGSLEFGFRGAAGTELVLPIQRTFGDGDLRIGVRQVRVRARAGRAGDSGGGFAAYDAATDRWSGGGEFVAWDKLGLRALFLNEPALAAGRRSWLALATAEFPSPAWFVPKGVGVLYAHNRATDPTALLAAVAAGDLPTASCRAWPARPAPRAALRLGRPRRPGRRGDSSSLRAGPGLADALAHDALRSTVGTAGGADGGGDADRELLVDQGGQPPPVICHWPSVHVSWVKQQSP